MRRRRDVAGWEETGRNEVMRGRDLGGVLPINLCEPLIRKSSFPHGAMEEARAVCGLQGHLTPSSDQLTVTSHSRCFPPPVSQGNF